MIHHRFIESASMEINLQKYTKRNPVFDIMKGIGIILVMVGHIPESSYLNIGSISAENIYWFVKHVFPPFKMPMFFLLAGYLTKPWAYEVGNGLSQVRSFALKKFDRLLIPYLVSFGLLIIWSVIPAICKQDWHMPVRHLISMIWGGQTSMWSEYFGHYFDGIRVSYMWFLLALFWGLIILFVLSRWLKLLLANGILLSILACAIYPLIKNYSPWTILQGLGAMQFLVIGHWLRTHKLPRWFWRICVICYFIEIRYSGISMAYNAYTCYPLDVLGALGGTYCLYWLAYGISKLKYSCRLWSYIGSITLAILCFHTIEPLTDIFNSIRIRSSLFMQLPDLVWISVRYIFVIICAIVFTKLPFFRKIYY